MKFVEIYTRHNKRTKDANIREIRDKIREQLKNNLGTLIWEKGSIWQTEDKYYVPNNWFVILKFEDHQERLGHQRVILEIEHFGEPVGFPWYEGQLRLLIQEHRLRKIKNKQEG